MTVNITDLMNDLPMHLRYTVPPSAVQSAVSLDHGECWHRCSVISSPSHATRDVTAAGSGDAVGDVCTLLVLVNSVDQSNSQNLLVLFYLLSIFG